jgi:ElaB/YqjD/DUF883 family membrane-anchored ribosome-binding protein
MPNSPGTINRVTQLEKNMIAVQKDNEMQLRIFQKLEVTVEKIHDLSESMHRLVSTHEEKILRQQEESENINLQVAKLEEKLDKETVILTKKIDENYDKILKNIKEILEEWKKKEEKHQDEKEKSDKAISQTNKTIEKWKWFILGAAFILGFLIDGIKERLVALIFGVQ